MHLSNCPIEHIGILTVYIYKITVYHSIPGNDAVRWSLFFLQVEIRASRCDSAADLNKTALIKQSGNPSAC